MVRATAVSRRRAGRRRCCRRRNARLTSKGCIVSSTTQGTLQSRWRKARLAVNSCITSGATQGTLQSRLCNTRLTPKSCIVAVAKGCTRAQAHADGHGGFAGAGARLESAAGFALAASTSAAGCGSLASPPMSTGRTFRASTPSAMAASDLPEYAGTDDPSLALRLLAAGVSLVGVWNAAGVGKPARRTRNPGDFSGGFGLSRRRCPRPGGDCRRFRGRAQPGDGR